MQRDTSQRRAIRAAFVDANRPLSFDEAFQTARKQVPSLGIATVYRTVKALAEKGTLVPVDLPGEPSRFEVSGKGHHHHFSCDRCGKVFELNGCPPNIKGLLPPGFTMSRHEVVLYGCCAKCAGK